MLDFYESLDTLNKAYLISAFVGCIFFLAQLVMMFMGGMDLDSDLDLDDVDADISGDSDFSFKLLSFQGMTAFFMMFGLGGLTFAQSYHFEPPVSMSAGLILGLGFVWVYSKIFHVFVKLQHSGTINIKDAIGQEGTVYLSIKEGQSGQVQIAINNRLKVLPARTQDQSEVQTGNRVKVVEVSESDELIVEKT